MSPIMILGFALFVLGFLLVFVTLAMSGGMARRTQLKVLGELWDGNHGTPKRAAVIAGAGFFLAGAMVMFGGVSASDAERAQACVTRCETEGYESGRIGPNSSRNEDRSTWWVACICEAADKPTLEIPAGSLAR